MSKQQPDALRLAEMLTANEWPGHVTLVSYAQECVAGLLTQHARITELESQLAQRFDAADMATAAAQGFRDGVASLAASAWEPVAWLYESPMPDGSVFTGASAERLQVGVGTPPGTIEKPLYIAAPPAAQAEGWKPIETAPKDGQAILVTDGGGCYCVEWSEEFDWWTVDDNKLGPFRLRGSAPTHWMPTPAAPGPADGGSK